MRRARFLSAALSLLAGLLLVPSAHGAFHLMSIREVAPNPGSDPASAYIELQMYSSGQNFVSGHDLEYYDTTASTWREFTFPAVPVLNGDNQRTILIGASSSVGPVGGKVTPDFVWTGLAGLAAFANSSAVCFAPESFVDCVRWGGFDAAPLPSPAGTPAPAIGVGHSLTRKIGRRCPTLLEQSDDTNDSAADFEIASPTPRNNSTAPTERPCDGNPGPGGDNVAPRTTITGHPRKRTRRTTARFRFRSSEAGSTFRCKLDRRPWRRCRSPRVYRNLRRGRHTFRVAATDRAGNRDPTPARFTFRVLRRAG